MPVPISPRLMLIKLSLNGVPFIIISCFAPTLVSDSEAKNKFYCDLDTLMSDTPADRFLLAIGDFNTRTGSTTTPGLEVSANMG